MNRDAVGDERRCKSADFLRLSVCLSVCLSAILFGFDWKFFSAEDESARSP